MKDVTERDENNKAWETFIQSLTVETLLDSYMESYFIPDYMISSNIDDVLELETSGDCMAILHGVVWYLFSTPISMWGRPVHDGVDRELFHMLDFSIVEDFIRMIEL